MSFVVGRDKEVQEWKAQKMPKPLPGFSGGRPLGRSIAEKCREEQEEVEENRKIQIKNEMVKEVTAGMKPSSQRAVEQKVKQNWDCSQIEDRDEEETMEWCEDDELKKQSEEVNKVEERLKIVGSGGVAKAAGAGCVSAYVSMQKG